MLAGEPPDLRRLLARVEEEEIPVRPEHSSTPLVPIVRFVAERWLGGSAGGLEDSPIRNSKVLCGTTILQLLGIFWSSRDGDRTR